MEVYRIDSDDLSRIEEQELSSEKSLESYLIRTDGAQIGGVEILYIDQQGSPGEGGIFDIVGLDDHGELVIIELKRARSPRDIVAQALEYAASIRNEDYEQLESRYRGFVDDDGVSLQVAHAEFFDRKEPLSEREFNTDQRLLLVGRDFSDLSLDMADFLREHGIDVICVTYSSFASEEEELRLLTTESVRRPLSEEPASVSGRRSSSSRESTVELKDGDAVIETFEERGQSDAMEAVANYLIEEYDLLQNIQIPYVPGRGDRALINDSPTHPDGSEMRAYRELIDGYYIMTNLNAASKRRYIDEIAQQCGLTASSDI